jgi:hypothetical protein
MMLLQLNESVVGDTVVIGFARETNWLPHPKIQRRHVNKPSF